jgi:phage shock protein PspC (stress-responsive transcriptional regulator)
MHDATPRPTAAHQDNLIGICHAIGSDFGFNPLYLRIALAVTLLFSPEAMLIAYASAGLLVLASRLLVRPGKQPAKAAKAWVPQMAASPSNAPEQVLAIAA